jgi:hypothetical protein
MKIARRKICQSAAGLTLSDDPWRIGPRVKGGAENDARDERQKQLGVELHRRGLS